PILALKTLNVASRRWATSRRISISCTVKKDIVPGSSQQPKCGSFIEYSAGLTEAYTQGLESFAQPAKLANEQDRDRTSIPREAACSSLIRYKHEPLSFKNRLANAKHRNLVA